jgi:hypothetical protein
VILIRVQILVDDPNDGPDRRLDPVAQSIFKYLAVRFELGLAQTKMTRMWPGCPEMNRTSYFEET